MAAGSKEKELEDTLPGADELAVSAEASELRRRLLAVGSNDNGDRQRSSTLARPEAAGEQQPSERRALRATLQFVRRRPSGNEEVTITAVSGAPPMSPDEAAPREGGDLARPSRGRIVLPMIAGGLLVVVALIHRSLSSAVPARAESLAAPPVMAPAPTVSTPLGADARRGSLAPVLAEPAAGGSKSSAAPKVVTQGAGVEPPRPAPDEEAVHLPPVARGKAVRTPRASRSREAIRAEVNGTPASREPAALEEARPETAPATKPRPRLVDDGPRPGLLD